MHLGGAGVHQHRHELLHRVAPHDRVVDDHDSLARDLVERVELESDPLPAELLVGLDERPPDVAVLDQPLVVRDPGGFREADRGGRARVRNRHHEVGLDGRLGCEALPHAHARAVHLGAAESRVGPREVDVLEDAERPPALRQRLQRVHPLGVDPHDLAGAYVPLDGGADQIERAALRRDDPVVADTPERERPDPVRIAEGDKRVVDERDDRVRTLKPRHRRGDRLGSGDGLPAIRPAITSVSEVEPKRVPSAVSSARSSTELVRFPLCPSATVRTLPWCTTGCAFDQWTPPVVE